MNPANPTKAQPAIATPVLRAIGDAARRTGVDFDYLVDQARIESGFRPDARAATSSATGLYQFTEQTWLGTVKAHGAAHGFGQMADAIGRNSDGRFRVDQPGMRQAIMDLRTDPAMAALMAGELAADNQAHLEAATGRSPEPVDLYLAHFLGAEGATKFLRAWAADPDQPAAPLHLAAAQANRAVFYNSNGQPRSLGEIRTRFAHKLDGGGTIAAPPQASTRMAQSATLSARPPQLRSMEPMPQNLSLDFARNAYRRLSAMGGGSA